MIRFGLQWSAVVGSGRQWSAVVGSGRQWSAVVGDDRKVDFISGFAMIQLESLPASSCLPPCCSLGNV
jgi:hypothetical protein